MKQDRFVDTVVMSTIGFIYSLDTINICEIKSRNERMDEFDHGKHVTGNKTRFQWLMLHHQFVYIYIVFVYYFISLLF